MTFLLHVFFHPLPILLPTQDEYIFKKIYHQFLHFILKFTNILVFNFICINLFLVVSYFVKKDPHF